MSVVTGTGGGTGGSTAYFSSFLATTDKTAAQGSAPVTGSVSGTVGATTLSTPQIPSHSHPGAQRQNTNNGPQQGTNVDYVQRNVNTTGSTGGGGSHTTPFSGILTSASADVDATVPAADVKYANVLIAAKD